MPKLIGAALLQNGSERVRTFTTSHIDTPGLLKPSMHGQPSLRVKPQPLSWSMIAYKRALARPRRILQERTWYEMLWHVQQESSSQSTTSRVSGEKRMRTRKLPIQRDERMPDESQG